MPFPALVQGVLWEPGPPDNSPQKARVMLANVAAGEALNQGVKRKSDQIEDAGSRPVSSRDWPLQENRVVGNNEKSHDDSRARDGENSSIPIDVEEIRNSAPSISADVKESRASYTTSHPAASTEAPEDYREAIESESEELRLTEKERKCLLASVAKVEAMLEREKWNLVAEAMKLAGTSKYPGAFLEKEYRKDTAGEDDNVELSNKGSTVSSPGHIPKVMRSQDQVPGPLVSLASHTHSIQTEGPRATRSQSSANNHQGFGTLFDRGPLQYSPQQVPENVRARMAEHDSSFHNQASYPTHSTRLGTPPMQLPLNAVDEPYPQPTTKRPLPYKKPGQNPSQHEAPPTEAFLSLKGASIPSIQYTSTGAPIFVDNPAPSTTTPERTANAFPYTSEASPAEVLNATEAAVAVVDNSAFSTPALERTACVSPYNSAGSPAEVPTAAEAAVTEAPTPAATQPKTWTAFMSVNEFRDERQRDQSLERQQGPAVTEAPALVATPPITESTFVALNGPHDKTQDDQRLATDAPASLATLSNTETAFVPVNGPRNGQQDDQVIATNTTGAIATRSKTGTAFVSVNESSGEKQSGQSLETAKWEWQDTRSRPRLANDSYFVLEREYQQDPKPTAEYKEGLAKTLDTTYPKINNWYSNRRSKANTQAKQLRALQDARRNSSTVDPSPIESGRGVSTPVTEATPETEQIQHLDHGTEASTNALPQVKPEVFQATESINLAPQQSTPATPSSQSGSIGDKGQPLCRTPDSHETRSSAMKAAWARRKAQGRNGRDGGTPKHSTVVSHSLMGSSPVTFAAQILAAAEEAQKNASPTLTPTPQDCESLPSPSPSQATPERFAGATSWTQSPGTTAYSRLGKKHGPYKKRNVSGLAATRAYSPSSQLHSPSLSGPSSPYGYPNHGYMPRGESVDSEARPSKNRQSVCGKCGKDHMKHQPICDIGLPGTDSESDDSLAGTSNIRQYVCEGCGKVYQQFAGLKYHKEHHPKCEAEPPRAGKRTDLAGMTESRRV